MSTFWERVGGVGDGASEPLVLEDLRNAFILYSFDIITMSDVRAWVGLTTEQGAEFAHLFEQFRPSGSDIATHAAKITAAAAGARAGRPALDSALNLMQACGYGPYIPPEPTPEP